MTRGAALPKSCGLCLLCVPESRSANAQSIRRTSGYWPLLSLRYCRSQRMPFAVIYKNKAESLFTSLPPFIIIEDLRIYRVFFTHSTQKRAHCPLLSILIVSTAGNNPQKSVFINVVDESVYIINSSAPRFSVTKRFRFLCQPM